MSQHKFGKLIEGKDHFDNDINFLKTDSLGDWELKFNFKSSK